MQKGVTVEQVARVTRAFSDAGIMVHAYLMYGFPTETAQDTIDALERVRQLFAAGCIRSEEHTSELQSQSNLVCRLLLEKKKNTVLGESTLSSLRRFKEDEREVLQRL